MPAFSDWQESVLSIFVSAPCVRLSELSTIMTRFPCIASHPTLRTMGRSRSAAIESAQENLKTAFTSNPPSAIQAKYVHIELWTASAFNALLLVLAARILFRLERQGIIMAAATSRAIPR